MAVDPVKVPGSFVRLQGAYSGLRAAEQRGHDRFAYPEYAQNAVAIYYRMTRSVLALYEAAELPGLPQLQAVL